MGFVSTSLSRDKIGLIEGLQGKWKCWLEINRLSG